ncbi:MAG: menaquinol-cytochrome C reductase, partial [Pirellulales bacterium]
MVVRLATVVLAMSGFGWLTWTSYVRDWSDADFLASQADSQVLAARAQVLADRNEMPAEGGGTLLRNDSKTQGPLLFARHCASCHPYADAQGHGIAATEPSAPNLYGFGTAPWISGLLDPATIKGSHYFGKTKLAEGEMASAIQAKIDEAEENTDELRQKLKLVAQALAAEAALRTPSVDDRPIESVAAGIALLTGELSCIDCHKFHDQGELGSAPDLTGYGSREWLAG